jgi:hypothetical protein
MQAHILAIEPTVDVAFLGVSGSIVVEMRCHPMVAYLGGCSDHGRLVGTREYRDCTEKETSGAALSAGQHKNLLSQVVLLTPLQVV